MGAGLAKQALLKYPQSPKVLAKNLMRSGNALSILFEGSKGSISRVGLEERHKNPSVLSFPTKHHWRQKSDLALMARSSMSLWHLMRNMHWVKVIIPQVGCGLGRLDWVNDVKPLFEKFDDRLYVITFP